MNTEENILYQLLDTIRGSELNSDEVIDEREVRAYLRTHRAALLWKYARKGYTIPDICFQNVALTLNEITGDLTQFTTSVPKIVYLKHNFGTMLRTISGANIPIVSNEEYNLGKTHILNKYKPKAKVENEVLTVFIGGLTPYNVLSNSPMQSVINEIKDDKSLLLRAVLVNTDDAVGYDWTTSEYPFPPEAIKELKDQVLRREFNLILNTKSDQIPNTKNDTLRYHDQGTVNK